MSQSVLLSPLDQYMPRIYTNLFLVFATSDPIRTVDILTVGFRRLTDRLPYLKGRVFATDSGRVGIRWSPADSDVELQEMRIDGVALAGMSLSRLTQEGVPLHYFRPSLSPLPRGTSLESGSDAPVMAANYTLLEGGVVVGVSVQHNVMDGTGVVELIRFWADCTRSNHTDEPSAPAPEEPLHREWLLRLATGRSTRGEKETRPSFNDLLARHPEFTLRAQQPAATPSATTSPSPLGSSKIFTLNISKLNTVKAALHATAEPSLDRKWITTNTILCAILWSCITRIRIARRGAGGLGAADSKLGFAVNGRPRLSPNHLGAPAGRPFLGNVNLFGLASVSASELERAAAPVARGSGSDCAGAAGGLAVVVEAIAGAIRRVTPEFVAEVMDLVDGAPDTADIMPGWSSVHGADLTVTSWANMGLYESDFGEGVGRPEFLRVPDMEVDGFSIVLPRKRREGGSEERIEVVVALHPEDMATLERDALWKSCLV